jgi:hypothetical protein
MSDERIPFVPTDKALILSLQGRVEQLEYILRHFDRSSMNLHLYVKGIHGMPSGVEWELIREQIWDMVDPYGDRNPNG